MNKVRIRKARSGDAAGVAELSGILGYPSSAGQMAGRIQAVLKSEEHGLFVAALPGGPLVGWIHVFISRRIESDPFSEIGGFVVAGTYRGSGIGRLLLTAAEEWTRQKAVTKIRIRSRTVRRDSHAVFQKLGYKISKEQFVFDKGL